VSAGSLPPWRFLDVTTPLVAAEVRELGYEWGCFHLTVETEVGRVRAMAEWLYCWN